MRYVFSGAKHAYVTSAFIGAAAGLAAAASTGKSKLLGAVAGALTAYVVAETFNIQNKSADDVHWALTQKNLAEAKLLSGAK